MNSFKKAALTSLALSGILYAGSANAADVKAKSTSPFIDSYLVDADARFSTGSYEANSKAQSGASFLPATSTGSQSVIYSEITPGIRFLRNNVASLPIEIKSTSASLENEVETLGRVGEFDVSETGLSFGGQYKRIFPWKDVNFSANAGLGYRTFSENRTGSHDILDIEQNENASGLEYSFGAGMSTEKVTANVSYRKASMSGEAKSEVSIPSFNLTLPDVNSNYERNSGLLRLEARVNLHKWANLVGRVEFGDLLRIYETSGVEETSDERLKKFELGWLSPEFKGISGGVYGGMSNSSGFSSAKKSDETSSNPFFGIILKYNLDTGRLTSTGLVQSAPRTSATGLVQSTLPSSSPIAPSALSATTSEDSDFKIEEFKCYRCKGNQRVYVMSVDGECSQGYQSTLPDCRPKTAPKPVAKKASAKKPTKK